MPTIQDQTLQDPTFVPVREKPHVQHSSVPSRRPTRWFSRILWTAAVCAVGVGLWAYLTGRIGADHREVLPPETEEALVRPAGIMVTAEKVTLRPVKRTIEAVGTLHGFEEIVVSAKAEGRILRLLHDVSDRVNPDELLVEMDPTDLRLTVEQAKGNVQVELAKLGLTQSADSSFDLSRVPTVILAREKRELARLKMERIQNLALREATTQEGVDNAVSEFRMASAEFENQMLMAKSGLAMIETRQAALAIAQQQLSDTSVRAPVPQNPSPDNQQRAPYVMTRRSIAEGSFVRVGDELCRLVIDGTLKLKVAVPERHISEIQVGQPVDVLTASSTTPHKGIVTVIYPSVETGTRTFLVEVQVPNNSPSLRPGSFAKAVIEVRQDQEARTVPLSAMVRYAGVIKLFSIEDGKATEVQFTPGIQTAEWVEVADPVLPKDCVVVTSGQFHLATGTQVAVRDPVTGTNSATSSSSSESDHH